MMIGLVMILMMKLLRPLLSPENHTSTPTLIRLSGTMIDAMITAITARPVCPVSFSAIASAMKPFQRVEVWNTEV